MLIRPTWNRKAGVHFSPRWQNEAAKIQHAEKRQIECVYGINEPTELPHYQRLVARMKAHQFAGLIFASHPGRLTRDRAGGMGRRSPGRSDDG